MCCICIHVVTCIILLLILSCDPYQGERLSIPEEDQLVVITHPSAESSGGSSPSGEQERVNGVNGGTGDNNNNNDDDDGISYPNPDVSLYWSGDQYGNEDRKVLEWG